MVMDARQIMAASKWPTGGLGIFEGFASHLRGLAIGLLSAVKVLPLGASTGDNCLSDMPKPVVVLGIDKQPLG
jgi:hypothetical protein